MPFRSGLRSLVTSVFAVVFCMSAAHPNPGFADEGMYLFNELPTQLLKERHQFTPTAQWAKSLQLSSVRFNSGGSGSFVSSNGLVLTNHHVASDTLQKLSTPDRNLVDNGYLASDPGQELKAPDLELNVLIEMIDVTQRVQAAVTQHGDAEAAAKQRQASIATIEKESTDETGLRSDVVTLFGGAQYHLYRYKKYTDVRLVWAPETKAAFFGGDADNFEYPRYNLDATIFRVYENDQPAQLEHFLKWSDVPLKEDDLIFVSGHPGRTQRIFTVEALEYLRDVRLPFILDYLRRKEVLLQQYRLESNEAARRGRDELFGIQNGRKAYTGMLAGLQDPQTIASKRGRQNRLKSAALASPELAPLVVAFDQIAEIQTEKAAHLRESVSLRSDLFSFALSIVLMTQEDLKPNAERYPEYTESARESMLTRLTSPAPLYDDLQRVKLADEIALLMERRGGDDELVREVLAGRSPQEVAAELVAQTKIGDPAVREELIAGGYNAVLGSNDPMVQLARKIEPVFRSVRQTTDQLDEREKQAYAQISRIITAAEGTSGYPDATFTLRLAFGTVKGYRENGQPVEPTTDLAGAFTHSAEHEGQEDFDLPQSWLDAKESLDLTTQLNFVSTADIIGGNSGSPVVDRKGNLVGLIFDGNIQSLTSDYLYSDAQSRAVSVSGVGIKEAIRKIYQAPSLADQLGR
ncbi:dipeptidyl-peptidase 7. Serine peptidase. MEROPS family S46 [Neorhodopirellula lusitana]|uniref:Dipeptidyl-peptidase n=2 Tax=Neorhodopirellula lusitana TaxID=445327 RepID=A0ABY1PX15_9BACT|nr:dipeptidyl-peptidase 7. Serine peptidase. MEROPS family S46 [Neorhodopirellula lusitana]